MTQTLHLLLKSPLSIIYQSILQFLGFLPGHLKPSCAALSPCSSLRLHPTAPSYCTMSYPAIGVKVWIAPKWLSYITIQAAHQAIISSFFEKKIHPTPEHKGYHRYSQCPVTKG